MEISKYMILLRLSGTKSESRRWQVRENDVREVRTLHNKNQTLLEVGDGTVVVEEVWMWSLDTKQQHKAKTKQRTYLIELSKKQPNLETWNVLRFQRLEGTDWWEGRTQSVPTQKHTSSSHSGPPMTFSALPSVSSPFPRPCPSLLPVTFIFTS